MNHALTAASLVALTTLLAVAIGFVVAVPIQYCWNYVMPDVFGLNPITYWQALALDILVAMLFGSKGSVSSSNN